MRFSHWFGSSARSHDSRKAASAAMVERLEARQLLSAAGHDVLYVGDGTDNSIKRFDAHTGAALSDLVAPNGGRLDGPRGMILMNPDNLLVLNQNVTSATLPGEILDYNTDTGALVRAVVPATDPNAPGAPFGMVLKGHVLYVANQATLPIAVPQGAIDRYDVDTGKFLGSLFPTGFSGQWNPTGIVVGPDGKLYISAIDSTDPNRGYVMRMDPDTGAWKIIAQNKDDGMATPGEIADMHHVGGLAFSPGGDLYVADHGPVGENKIFGFNVHNDTLINEISMDAPSGPAEFTAGVVFGPGGKLFAPIYGSGPDTGAVREYDISNDTYTNFVPPGGTGTAGPAGAGWLLTFGKSDPATLAYNPHGDDGSHDDRWRDDDSDANADQGDDSDSSDGDRARGPDADNSPGDIVTAVLQPAHGHVFAQ
ncbi:MAG TPA: hypothetical protein VFC78_18080 [Tepidisphaeraceae bacterium]|nr:hypothetical protein [Tepidisphaeraceae bacterium]